jgi:hypothetical protein
MKSLLKDIQETPNFEAKLDRYQTIEVYYYYYQDF